VGYAYADAMLELVQLYLNQPDSRARALQMHRLTTGGRCTQCSIGEYPRAMWRDCVVAQAAGRALEQAGEARPKRKPAVIRAIPDPDPRSADAVVDTTAAS
jgi:hypothetical protein